MIMVAPVKPTIKFGDLEKIDVRVGTIETVEDIEKSDKLVKLIVDFGDFKRNITTEDMALIRHGYSRDYKIRYDRI